MSGIDAPYVVATAGWPSYGSIVDAPRATPLRAGDVLAIDAGARVDGYWCDFDRNFLLAGEEGGGAAGGDGAADDAVLRAHDACHAATDAALAAARPGATCGAVFGAMARALEARRASRVPARFSGGGIEAPLKAPPAATRSMPAT